MLRRHYPMTLYESRPPRWAHFIMFVLCVGLGALFVDLVFLPGFAFFPTEFDPAALSGFERIVFGFFALLAAFLAGVAAYRVIRRPTAFRLTDEGFEYAPGGVSTGFIRWTDVEEIKYTAVNTGGGEQNRRKVLGVYLKDPASFIARYPVALHALFEARKYQSGTPLVFQSGEFGRDHDKVVALMQEQLRRAKGERRH
jgi:hypothetical protein